MAVTASMVKELRQATGSGMMDCKKALVEANEDMEKAIEVLREKGLSKAAKKADRIAAEGLVKIAFEDDAKKAAIVEVNSETDFVAKNAEFIGFVEDLAKIALATEDKSIENFMTLSYKEEGTVTDVLNTKISKIGENMNVRRFVKCATPGVVYTGYVHGGGTIGAIVGIETEATREEVAVVGRDVAMQVASMNPKFVDETSIDQEYIAKEKEILTQMVLNEGKKPEMVERIVEGKIKKELKEVCLVEQKFVKNGDLTVEQYVETVAKEVGKAMKVVEMVRYEVGEGIEKKSEDFAAEVAAQLAK
ncbi:MAG: elongation factor Ts [Peptostreptococcaceae bacterium]|nr:elongation factor Ts [Peptostreptococcaceae bacterium]